MPNKMRKPLQLNQLEHGMCVEVYNRHTSDRRTGIVVKADTTRSGLLIDGKPVQRLNKIEVIIEHEEGDAVTLTKENFGDYQITRI